MADTTRNLNITPEEIQQGKTMAIIAYLIFFIPLLMDDMRKNNFVMFHTEQALANFLLGVVISIIGSLTCIGLVLWFVPLVFCVMGIMNASNGEMKPLPIIGQYAEKFNLVK